MKQPNEYWLKYMLMFSGLTLEQIAEMAIMYEMTPPDTTYLSALRDKLLETRPTPFRITSTEARAWVRRQRFMSLVKEDKYAVKARDLLGDTRVRPIVEALILSDMPHDEVSSYTKIITGAQVSKRTLEMFQHYFWNRDLLSTRQWYSYLEGHPKNITLKACYALGPKFALWKSGYRPELQQKEVIKGLFDESAMRFFETTAMPNGKDTAMTAKLWAENIFRATEELNRTGDAVQQVVDGLRDIAIKLGKRDISSIHELADPADEEDSDVRE